MGLRLFSKIPERCGVETITKNPKKLNDYSYIKSIKPKLYILH